MKRALLQKKKENELVQCLNCAHLCLVDEGGFGICKMRQNKNGELKVCNYGKVAALNIDPIEKKPLYHFLPGTESLSLGVPGCSFNCKNCQNWSLSQKKKEDINGRRLSPANIVKIAKDKKLKSISYTYSEPIIFLEYALDIMTKAKKEGIKNVWVSNGYFSDLSLQKILPYIDAINIDLKSFSKNFYKDVCNGRLEPVLDAIKKIQKDDDTWLELTTLLIPGYNDDTSEITDMARFIADLDKDIPWHLSRFSSRFSKDMKDIPDTPMETMEKAYRIAKNAGLNYVYQGNVVNGKTDTHCPKCNFTVIQRENYKTKRFDEKDCCPDCNRKVKLIN